jgi:hypothetical protein
MRTKRCFKSVVLCKNSLLKGNAIVWIAVENSQKINKVFNWNNFSIDPFWSDKKSLHLHFYWTKNGDVLDKFIVSTV